jgi:TRAP transporter TAXI family solute receptor
MRKRVLALVVVAVVALALGGAARVFINIGTGGTAGTYYPLGGAMAEIINKAVPEANATAVSTNASVANINQLLDDELQIAMVQNDVTYYAYTGTELFAKSRPAYNLRGIACLYDETIQLVTVAGTGITQLSDIRGKRVGVGAPASGTEVNARQILESAGITYKDIQVQYLDFANAANALRDGTVDVGVVTAGEPTAAIRDLATQKDVVLIPVPAATADKLIAKYPYYTKYRVPANVYPKQTSPVETVAVKAMLLTTDSMPTDLVYSITKALFSPAGLERLGLAHAKGKLISRDTALSGMPILLHAGAEKFFKE